MSVAVPFHLKTFHRLIAFAILVGVVVVGLRWLCVEDPQIAFLPADSPADWILFPTELRAGRRHIASQNTFFRREFVVSGEVQTAQINVRAFKQIDLTINGKPVRFASSDNWKHNSFAKVASDLRLGTNTIEAKISNDTGPPALWLVLNTDGTELCSDETWETSRAGSEWIPAVRATQLQMPGKDSPMAGGEAVLSALTTVWPDWMIFCGIAMAVLVAGRRCYERNQFWHRETIVILTFIAMVWTAWLCNDTRRIPLTTGFDAQGHIDYIEFIQKHWALPLPNDGWEMFQPPLYYVTSAVVLSSFGLPASDEAAVMVLHALGTLFGLVQVALIFFSLRLFFPNQIGRQLVGVALIAFLPMRLYMSQYVSNEMMAATFGAAAIFLCLRLLQKETTSLTECIVLGLCLGASILTKATGILLIPLIGMAIIIKLTSRKLSPAAWFRELAVPLGVSFMVCGWYYIWIWVYFGKPFIGNWDAATGFQSWQDRGYHTAADFYRFGRTLTRPLFSAFAGFPDGIYSTLWGDGLCGGNIKFRPPWNYNLMCAGYLLALFPSLLVLAGVTVSSRRFFQRPSAECFLMLGVAATAIAALVLMNLAIPSYAEAKAFYASFALTAFCFFGVVGWGVLTRGKKKWEFISGLILLTWAINSLASFWVVK